VSSNYENYQVQVTKDTIITACYHLVAFNESSDTCGFGHFSVAEYIQEQERTDFGEAKVHELLAGLCPHALHDTTRVIQRGLNPVDMATQGYVKAITDEPQLDTHLRNYIDLSTQEQSLEPLGFLYEGPQPRSTFFLYAAECWAFHCQRSGSDDGPSKFWDTILQAWFEYGSCALLPHFRAPETGFGYHRSRELISYRLYSFFKNTVSSVNDRFIVISCKRTQPTPYNPWITNFV
jgi:hypothetical protein